MSESPSTLIEYSHAIVATPDLDEKVRLAKIAAQLWHRRKLSLGLRSTALKMPDRPGRPDKPELLSPKEMPKRSARGTKGKIALLHSLAHIELNAIDMTWDLIGRFGWANMPSTFFDNWVRVGVEEAKHFDLLKNRLTGLGASYGDLPAHDGLWQTAQDTGEDLLARIAIVPLVLEARGLDVTPAMIRKMTESGDEKSASILSIIYRDEKNHVAFGYKWFRYMCEKEGRVPEPTFHMLVRKYFKGHIKPPFNDKARSEAGLTPGFYKPLSALGSYG
ncbi:MAG: ferritin-like domain-containing protein [Methyloligellaceae bacterium]